MTRTEAHAILDAARGGADVPEASITRALRITDGLYAALPSPAVRRQPQRPGIRTLADLQARCVVDPNTGCWHWQGYTDDKGPRVSFRGPDGTWQTTQGRRAALILSGRQMAGKVAYARLHCRCADCIALLHSASGTRAEWTRIMVKRGVIAPSPNRQRAFTAVQVARRVMTMATAEAMRAEVGKTHRQLAEEYGVKRGVVHSVLAGLTYRRPAGVASVWQWRPAGGDSGSTAT